MHQTFIPRLEFPPLLLRLRAGIASALLSAFGLKSTARRARWLATVTAHAAARQPNDNAVADAARRRLASLTDGALMRHRASRETLPAITQARAAIPTMAQVAQEAVDAATRLEAMVPPGVVEESPSWVLRGLLVAGLLAESLVVYASVGATPLADSPLVLAATCLTLPTLAAAILSRSGAIARRSVWRQRICFADGALVVLGLLVAITLGVGLTLSRVGDISTGRTAALLTSAGLQSVILLMPFIDGYLHASPVPGLRRARRLRDSAVRQHDAQIVELRRLEAEHAEREIELLADAEATHSEFERTLAQLGGSSIANYRGVAVGATQVLPTARNT